MGALESRQSILPRTDGTFPVVQLTLSGVELPLWLNDHRI
jgi:hypothetical protein